jgi:hypothetical protein
MKILRYCEQCGNSFYTMQCRINKGIGKYCSNKCKGESIKKRIVAVCPICFKEFETTQNRIDSGRGKFCSRDCYYASEGKPPVTKKCLQCGNKFSAEYNQVATGKGKFCSRECKGKWMSENLIKDKALRWNPLLSQQDRKEARKDTEYSEWRLSVFTRDKFICQHCGYNKGKVLHAHHIIPFSIDKSLRTELSNGITLCAKCHKAEHKRLRNMLKGQVDFFVI